jgi:hypothetical protein
MRTFANAFLACAAAMTIIAAEPTPLQLMPPDADSIGGVDVAQTLLSPFGHFVLEQMKKDDPKLREMIESTGFDPRTQLRSVVFAGAPDSQKGVVVAQGVFNGPQILQAAKAKGATITQYGRYELAVPAGTKGEGALAVVNGALAVLGDTASVKAVLDRLTNGPGAQNPLVAKAATLAGQHHAWLVSNNTRSLPKVGPAAQFGNIEGVEQVSGGVKFGSIIQVSGEAVARSDKDAEALMNVVQFMKSWAQLNSGKNGPMPLEPFIQSMQAQAQGRTVFVTAQIAQVDVEKLMKRAGPNTQRRRAAR